MAKKDKAAAPTVSEVVAEATGDKSVAVVGVRGLKGVPLTAVITLLAAKNPKRPGCAAEKRFALYETGKTVQKFLDEGGTTPDLAYDTAHGYISVEGYTPKKMFEAKPKKEPKPKAEKKEKAPKVEKSEATKEVEAEVVAEMID